MIKSAFEAILNSQNKDNKKSKHYKDCFYSESYLYIDCFYLFIKVYKSDQNLKPEIEKKVKEAFIKILNRIKRALKKAKAEFKKKAFTFIFKTLFTFTKLNTFVV